MDGETLSAPTIRVRGRSFMAMVLTPEFPFGDWFAALDRQLAGSPGFFSDRPVVADLAGVAEVVGPESLPIVLDVSRTAELAGMVERAVAHFGRLDALANMAGFALRKPILEATEEDYDRLMDVNLKAVYFASQAAARAMIAARQRDPTLPRGKILNIASLTSQIALPNIATYVASRSGVLGLTRSMALEWRRLDNTAYARDLDEEDGLSAPLGRLVEAFSLALLGGIGP